MTSLLVFCFLSLPMGPHGFVPRTPNNLPFRFSRLEFGGKVNVAEHELPLNHTNTELPAMMSDDDLEKVKKYRRLLANKFPATMVRHTMAKEGNDKPELLRSVFEELGNDDEINKMTKPADKVKKKTRTAHQVQTHSQATYEDPTGFFPIKSGKGGYVPAGLTESQYAKLKKEESDDKVGKNYGAWGPRFKPSDSPVADDMAWMAMPDLWTGRGQGDRRDDGESSEVTREDPELPLHDPSFLSNSRPWIHADARRSDVYMRGWRTTYKRFCEGETVQQLMLDVVSAEKVVHHILEGAVIYGGKSMADSQTCIDLNRVGIFSPPNKSDWSAMEQAEANVFVELEGGITALPDEVVEESGELMLCGDVSRSDFLREVIRIGQGSATDLDIDILDSFNKEDLQEMYLCMDWFITLRRIGISNPYD